MRNRPDLRADALRLAKHEDIPDLIAMAWDLHEQIDHDYPFDRKDMARSFREMTAKGEVLMMGDYAMFALRKVSLPYNRTIVSEATGT